MLEYIQALFLIPIGHLYQKVYNHNGRIATVEAKQETYEKKVDKMCKSNDKLTEKVDQMIGKVEEHLRKN